MQRQQNLPHLAALSVPYDWRLNEEKPATQYYYRRIGSMQQSNAHRAPFHKEIPVRRFILHNIFSFVRLAPARLGSVSIVC